MNIKNSFFGRDSASLIQKVAIILLTIFLTIVIFDYLSLTGVSSGVLAFSVIVFGFLLALGLYTYQNYPNKQAIAVIGTLSGLMAISIVIGGKISLGELVSINLVWKDALYWLAWSILIFYAYNFLFLQIQKLKYNPAKKQLVSLKLWLKLSITILLLWIPYLLAFFPGILNSDTSDQLNQALGGARLNDHHPVLIAGFISLFTHLGLFISGNYYIAIAFVTIAQMILAAFVLGYVSSWIIAKFNIPLLSLLTVLFFGIFPLVPYFMVTVGKDCLFALSVLLFTTLIYDFITSRGALLEEKYWLLIFSVVALLVIFTRNNGIYLVAISFFALAITYRQLWTRTVPVFIAVIALSLLVHGPLFGALKIPLSKSTESFGVLLQQVGRTIALNGDLSENDKQALAPILPIEKWSRYYNPATPDRLKFCETVLDACMNNAYLDRHKLDFLRAWASIGIKNPRIYLEAILTQNSGFWHIGSADDYGGFKSDENRYTTGSTDILMRFGLHAAETVYQSIQFIRSSPLGVLTNQGSFIWIILFTCAVLISQRRHIMLLALLPFVSLWLSLMVAAPAMSFRYSLATFLALPIISAIAITNNKEAGTSA